MQKKGMSLIYIDKKKSGKSDNHYFENENANKCETRYKCAMIST